MAKQYVELKVNGETIVVAPVVESSSLDYATKKEKADATFTAIIKGLLKRIDDLEKEVKILKGED